MPDELMRLPPAAPIHEEPITHEELQFMRDTARWWREDITRVAASRRLVKYEPELSAIAESRKFWRRLKKFGAGFCKWLAGLVSFLVAISELVTWVHHR